MQDIGFVGLGMMGGPMATNLLQRGFRVTVEDVRSEAVEVLVCVPSHSGEASAIETSVARKSSRKARHTHPLLRRALAQHNFPAGQSNDLLQRVWIGQI